MRYSLLIFDWDGTIMDSQLRIVASFHAAIAACGLPAQSDEAIVNTIGLGLPEAIEQLFPAISPSQREAVRVSYRTHYLYQNNTPMPLFPGAAEAIIRLAAEGYILAVATGKSRVGLDDALTACRLKDYFCVTRCAEETQSKPHPLMLQEIMAVTQTPIEKTLMIGDTAYDLDMAARAGCAAVALSYGAHDCDRMLIHQPLACLDSLLELVDWLHD